MPYPTPTSGATWPAPAGAPMAPDEETLRRERYERFLDAMMAGASPEAPGSGPGAQVPPQPQAAPQAVQQTAPRQPADVVPFEALLARLAQEPGMLAHMQGRDPSDAFVPDMPPLGPPPQDPVRRMEWLIQNRVQDNMAQGLRAKQARLAAERRKIANSRLLGFLAAKDPLFALTWGKVESFLRTLPPALGKHLYDGVDAHAGMFLELYNDFRNIILHFGPNHALSRGAPAPAQAEADPRQRVRQAVAGRMSAPALENAGALDERTPLANRAAQLGALKARVRAGQAREGDLLKYLELTGA